MSSIAFENIQVKHCIAETAADSDIGITVFLQPTDETLQIENWNREDDPMLIETLRELEDAVYKKSPAWVSVWVGDDEPTMIAKQLPVIAVTTDLSKVQLASYVRIVDRPDTDRNPEDYVLLSDVKCAIDW